jgi:uncharacterized protein
MSQNRTRLFFAADIHGSEVCFRKWLNAAVRYQVDAVIFGGDLAGKILQPIVRSRNGHYSTDMYGSAIEVQGASELEQLTSRIRNAGRYEVVVSAEEKAALDASPELVHETFLRTARATAERWLHMADERLRAAGVPGFMMLGNDDFREMQEVFNQAEWVTNPEDRLCELPGGYEMVSLGYSNPTPWNSPRELAEPDLDERIRKMTVRLREPDWSVFNFHVPPQGTHLDRAALLDENFRPKTEGGQILIGNVGSTSVRELLQEYQPVLSLHGHIHESPGVVKVKRTTSINPGSDYVDGILRGAIVTLDRKKGVRSWQLIQG